MRQEKGSFHQEQLDRNTIISVSNEIGTGTAHNLFSRESFNPGIANLTKKGQTGVLIETNVLGLPADENSA